jgi:hypothetical protein
MIQNWAKNVICVKLTSIKWEYNTECVQMQRVYVLVCNKYITYLVISNSNEESFLGWCGRNFKTHICLRHSDKKLQKHQLFAYGEHSSGDFTKANRKANYILF